MKRNLFLSEIEILIFLNELRESGSINMFGSIPYIMDAFDVNRKTASLYFSLWMEKFSIDENDYKDIMVDVSEFGESITFL